MRKPLDQARDRGAALAEFAILAPIFIFVLLAIVEMGVLSLNYLSVQDATREAARELAIQRDHGQSSRETLIVFSQNINVVSADLESLVVFAPEFGESAPDPADNCGVSTGRSGDCTSWVTGLDSAASIAALPNFSGHADTAGDLIGFQTKWTHHSPTGFFGSWDFTSIAIETVEEDL